MKKKVGIIGLGKIAQSTYLPILSVDTEVEIVGAFARTASTRAQICSQYRIPEFADVTALIAAADILFVHTATPSHYQLVKEILQQGKHVYVDKPLTLDYQEALELEQLALAQNVQLFVGFNRRYAPSLIALKEQMLPEFDYLRIEKHWHGSHNFTNFELAIDMFIHLVDTACFLADEKLTLGHVDVQNDADTGQLKFISVTFNSTKTNKPYIQAISHSMSHVGYEQVTVLQREQAIVVSELTEIITKTAGKETKEVLFARKPDYFRRGFNGAIATFFKQIEAGVPVAETVPGSYAQYLIEGLQPYL